MGRSLTKESKKQEILDYLDTIEKSPNQTDPFLFSKQKLIKRFEDDSYDAIDISKLLTELKDEGILDKNNLKIEIWYAKSKKQEVFDRWKTHLIPYDEFAVLVLLYITIIVGSYFFKRDSMDAAVMYPLILGAAYTLFKQAYQLTTDNIPLFKQMNVKLFLFVSIPVATFIIIAYFGTKALSQELTITVFLTAIAVGVALGSFLYKVFTKREPF